jgi:hypothetical protein
VGVTSFTTTGTLGFNASPPNNLGSVTASGITHGANSIDVTSLVQAAVTADQSYLGLYLTPQGPGDSYLWTYTFTGYGYNANSAGAQLVINYTVPENSATIVLLGIGVCLVGFGARRLT